MERSQSCTNFDLSNRTITNNNRVKSNKINNASSPNLRQAIELRQTMEYCQINFKHKQHHQHHQSAQTGSSNNLNKISMSSNNASCLPLFSPNRSLNKRLQRQSSTTTNTSNDDEFHDDINYHADLEEEELDCEPVNHNSRTSKHSFKKHLNFQRHKQHSESALIAPSSTSTNRLMHGESLESAMTTRSELSPTSQRRQRFAFLMRDNSIQSDSSRYSSVDSLLESRKPDPEAILINLGFGPVGTEDILSRIPKRFLKPSQVRGIDTDAFVKRLQLASNLADHSVLGYRGLTGNPDMPPSTIVAKIMERFEVNQRKKSLGSIEQTM